MQTERGQILPIYIVIFVLGIALLGLLLDGGLWFAHRDALQHDLNAACLAASNAPIAKLSPAALFAASLAANGVTAEYYEPYTLAPDQLPTKGIGWGTYNTLVAGLSGPHKFYLAQVLGFRSMGIAVRARCRYRTLALSPFAVQEPWVMRGLDQYPDEEFPIVGDGAAAVEYTGNDYAGTVILHVWCVDSAGLPDENCSDPMFFEPLTSSPTANNLKDVVQNTILGAVGLPYPPIGMHLPQISGVSNHFLVQTADARFDVGDRILVMVFPGTLYKPDPGYGNWDNVEITRYALAEITKFDPNTMWVKFVDGPFDSPQEVEDLLKSRIVPWDWGGPPA